MLSSQGAVGTDLNLLEVRSSAQIGLGDSRGSSEGPRLAEGSAAGTSGGAKVSAS
jgi:hypothetical protein